MASVSRAVDVSAAVLLALIVASAGFSKEAHADEIRDWPCKLPFAETFSPEEVWGGPLPAALSRDWRRDTAVKTVVEYAANPEHTASAGRARIADFATSSGGDRPQRLLLVFSGLIDEFSTLRGFLVDGIRTFVLRAKILKEAVDRNDAALAALPPDGGPQVQRLRAGYEQARFWDFRHMDDAIEEAEFICRRYAYLDKKLRLLAEGIRQAL